jgi:hypothetical protein
MLFYKSDLWLWQRHTISFLASIKNSLNTCLCISFFLLDLIALMALYGCDALWWTLAILAKYWFHSQRQFQSLARHCLTHPSIFTCKYFCDIYLGNDQGHVFFRAPRIDYLDWRTRLALSVLSSIKAVRRSQYRMLSVSLPLTVLRTLLPSTAWRYDTLP